MTWKKILFFSWGLLACGNAAAQSWAVFRIPENLRETCHAIVRSDITEFNLKDPASATESRTVVVTVLNEQGSDYADFSCFTDMYSSVKSFSGEVYDRDGKSIRKIRKGDLKFTDYFSGLASDTRYHYYMPAIGAYPYTVKYEYEIGYRNGILAFPPFSPVPGREIAVEQAAYKLSVPSGYTFHSRALNLDPEPVKREAGKEDIYEWKLENYPGLRYEPYGIPFYESVPRVYFSPGSFVYGKTSGTMGNWEEYAQWQWGLMKGRDVLPEGLQREIAALTGQASSDREKVRLLYDYLAATTRYVSIQIGIGGLQPMTVEEVYRTKFGDCKGLSFYMQALLKACGIDSYYAEIGISNRNLIPDFANPLLTNHAILQVPLEEETLWLECTAPELPFGYIHGEIAGRPALVYRDGTAVVEEVARYADSLNLSSIKAEITLFEDGSGRGNLETRRHLYRYENYSDFGKLQEREKINRIKSGMGLANLQVSNLVWEEEKNAIPLLKIGYDFQSVVFGSVSGSRIFVPLSPFRNNPFPRLGRAGQRKSDIYIEKGFVDRDVLTLHCPEGFEVETGAVLQSLDTPLGSFDLKVLPLDDRVLIIRELQLYGGRHDKSLFEEFKAFTEACSKSMDSRIVLVRKEN